MYYENYKLIDNYCFNFSFTNNPKKKKYIDL